MSTAFFAPLADLWPGLAGIVLFVALAFVPVAVIAGFLAVLRAAARHVGPWGDTASPSSGGEMFRGRPNR